jgi:hypothetical protein
MGLRPTLSFANQSTIKISHVSQIHNKIQFTSSLPLHHAPPKENEPPSLPQSPSNCPPLSRPPVLLVRKYQCWDYQDSHLWTRVINMPMRTIIHTSNHGWDTPIIPIASQPWLLTFNNSFSFPIQTQEWAIRVNKRGMNPKNVSSPNEWPTPSLKIKSITRPFPQEAQVTPFFSLKFQGG